MQGRRKKIKSKKFEKKKKWMTKSKWMMKSKEKAMRTKREQIGSDQEGKGREVKGVVTDRPFRRLGWQR